MTYRTIKVESIGATLVIRLARPDRLNAVSEDLAVELLEALQRLESARAVLITGEGRGFCAGADLASQSSTSLTGGAGAYQRLTQSYNPVFAALSECRVPVVCAVNGVAAGFGCSLALAADITIAAASAYFLQPFARIGLAADTGSTWTLPRLVGKSRAMAMLLLGDKVPAAQAEEWGLIYRCVEDERLMDEASALADRLANGPTVALGLTRRMMLDSMSSTFTDALDREAAAQHIAADTHDAREGIQAFVEKRPTRFAGH